MKRGGKIQRARTPIIFFTMGHMSTKTLVKSGTNNCGPKVNFTKDARLRKLSTVKLM